MLNYSEKLMMKQKKYKKEEREIFDENYDYGEGKVPPNAYELESQLLGSILIDNVVLNDVLQFLDQSHFYKKANAIIFSSMINLELKREPIDINTLKEELKRTGQLTEVGGIEYIIDLTTSVSTSANAEFYGRIIFEKHILRNLISISSKVVEKCFDPTVNTFEVLNTAEKKILDISESLSKKKVIAVKEELEKLFAELVEQKAKKIKGVTGVATGFDKLDEMTSGLQKSELIIVAGRPSHGKTAFGINIARNAAVKSDLSVAIFSLEMTYRELLIRMIASEARVDNLKIKTGKTNQSEWSNVAHTYNNLKKNIYIDDTSELSVLELRAKARRMKQEYNIDLIVVDYLQLIQGLPTHERRDLEVAYVSRSLKALAKELNIPVIACAQLNRGIEQRGGKTKELPQLADLRESGAIEQDADVVIFLHRPFLVKKPEKDDPKYDEIRTQSHVTIGKQRNGPTGSFDLLFIPEYTKFENITKMPDIAFGTQTDIDTPEF